MLPLCLTLHRRENIKFPKGRHPILVVFGLAAVWRFFFQRKRKKKKKNKKELEEKGREERTDAFSQLSAPSLAFFVIKNWNDETRTAITVHSPPLSPMHEQVTNKQKNEVFQWTKAYNQVYHKREKKNTKITDFLLHKNVCGIKQIQKRGTPLAWKWRTTP